MIGYIIPAIAYIKTFESEFVLLLNKLDYRSNTYEPVFTNRICSLSRFGFPLSMLLFGIIAMLAGLTSILIDIGSGADE